MPETTTPRRPRYALLLGLAALVIPLMEVTRVTLGPNFHEISPGKLYRSAQLSAQEIRSVTQRFGIKSIINLRNNNQGEPWYDNEVAVARELGIHHYDLSFSAYFPPAPQQLRRLISILHETARPVLIHCRRGADRTGLASGFAWLVEHADDPDRSLDFLSVRYGHVAVGKVTIMDRVFAEYHTWLGQQRRPHSHDALRHWVDEVYRPGACWARIEPLSLPDSLSIDRPLAARFRVHNLSNLAWEFHPSSNVGIHLRGWLDPVGAKRPRNTPPHTTHFGRHLLAAGFFHRSVPPGGHLDLDVALPAVNKPGTYHLFVDLHEEATNCYFHTLGSTSFSTKLEATRGDVASH